MDGPPGFRFIDLFAGIGGLRRGFDVLGGRCVFTSEWDRHAQCTYAANYSDGPDHITARDIKEVDPAAIPEHDVLLAGFPCQPSSIAGVSKKNALGQPHGFRSETQGTLFLDTARIIDHHRPRAFVLENVKNLVNHDRGRTFKIIRSMLEEDLGYHISWRVIDARGYVPQHRERILIAGLRDRSRHGRTPRNRPDPQLFPPRDHTDTHVPCGSFQHPRRASLRIRERRAQNSETYSDAPTPAGDYKDRMALLQQISPVGRLCIATPPLQSGVNPDTIQSDHTIYPIPLTNLAKTPPERSINIASKRTHQKPYHTQESQICPSTLHKVPTPL